MDDEQGSTADMRAFRWRAEPVLRKLQVQRDVGRQLFAVARREARARRQAAEDQDTAKQKALAWSQAAFTGSLDPLALSRALGHVMRLAAKVAEAGAAAQEGEDRADHARAVWLGVEAQIACLRKMRSAAAAGFASEQRRLLDKEADQLWLAQRSGK